MEFGKFVFLPMQASFYNCSKDTPISDIFLQFTECSCLPILFLEAGKAANNEELQEQVYQKVITKLFLFTFALFFFFFLGPYFCGIFLSLKYAFVLHR